MSQAWLIVAAVGAATVLLRGAGPALLGGRALPPRMGAMVELLPPALLAALVTTQVFASGQRLVVDERIAGLAAAGVALALRAPLLVVVGAAAGSTALARLVV